MHAERTAGGTARHQPGSSLQSSARAAQQHMLHPGEPAAPPAAASPSVSSLMRRSSRSMCCCSLACSGCRPAAPPLAPPLVLRGAARARGLAGRGGSGRAGGEMDASAAASSGQLHSLLQSQLIPTQQHAPGAARGAGGGQGGRCGGRCAAAAAAACAAAAVSGLPSPHGVHWRSDASSRVPHGVDEACRGPRGAGAARQSGVAAAGQTRGAPSDRRARQSMLLQDPAAGAAPPEQASGARRLACAPLRTFCAICSAPRRRSDPVRSQAASREVGRRLSERRRLPVC